MKNVVQARIVTLAAAIAHAEGFWVPAARPRRNNNPGDLVADGAAAGQFPSRLAGFDALADKLWRMLAGMSHVYPRSFTFAQFAQAWTGGDNAAAWCTSVCDDLAISPELTLLQWIQQTDPATPVKAPPVQSSDRVRQAD